MPMGHLIGDLHDLRLVVVAGDSVARGGGARGGNLVGGHGFARLLVENHPDFPDFAGRDLVARFPAVGLVDVGRERATSTQARNALYAAIALHALPDEPEGDVLLLLHAGGRDFFDSPEVMVDPERAAAAAHDLADRLANMISVLKARYARGAKTMVAALCNIVDPSDAAGALPEEAAAGPCSSFRDPRVVGDPDAVAANLGVLNGAIAEVAEKHGAVLVDLWSAFLGRGLTAPEADRWIGPDCLTLTEQGHHQVRQAIWAALNGGGLGDAVGDRAAGGGAPQPPPPQRR